MLKTTEIAESNARRGDIPILFNLFNLNSIQVVDNREESHPDDGFGIKRRIDKVF